MRILVATHNYPRFGGDPAGAFVARLARGVRAEGHDVRVLTPHAPGLAVTEVDGGVPVTRFRYAPERLEHVAYRGDLHRRSALSPMMALGVPAFLLAFAGALRRAGREFRPDVVHAHWWFPAGLLSAGMGRPFVVTCHGSDVRLLDRSATLRGLARSVLRRAAAVTAVSQFLARDLAARVPPAADLVRAVYMPLELERFAEGGAAPKAHPPRILYAGNLNPSKGVDVLLDAFALLRRQGIECRLRVLGEGPARTELRARGASLGLADDVEWLDFVPQHQMPSEYGASTVTVLPTRGQAEGLGLSLAEAVLAGSAVVGSPAGGIPEVVVHGDTGLIFADGDPASLAECLARLLADVALRERLVAAGRERARRLFAPEASVARFVELYESAAERQRAS